LANGYALKKAKTILETEHADIINTHHVIADFDSLKIDNIRNVKQTIAFNKLGAESVQLNRS